MHRLHDEAGSTSWLDERSSSQLVEPASSCKRGITRYCLVVFLLSRSPAVFAGSDCYSGIL